jgi:molybdopterin converting factor small subunit
MTKSSTLITVKVRTILTTKRIFGKGEVKFRLPEGSTLDDLLFSLINACGRELSPHLFNGDAKDRDQKAHISRIVINGRDIEFLNGLGTVLHEADEVLIIPIASGG